MAKNVIEKKQENIVATSDEWKRDWVEGVEITLSSGRIVSIRPVGAATFLAAGKIPDDLTPQVEKLIKAQNGMIQTQELITNLSDFQDQSRLVDIFCCTCLVRPKVVMLAPEDIEDDSLSIMLLSDDEKQEIFGTLGRSTRYIREFFRKQERDLEALYNSKEFRDSTIRNSGLTPVNIGDLGESESS